MTWCWRKKRPPSEGQIRDTEALDRATRKHAEDEAAHENARRVAAALRAIRERNHFAEQIDIAMRGKRS